MPKKLTDIIGNLPRVFTDQQGNNITVAPTENRRIAVLSDEQIVAVGAFVEVIKKIHTSNAPFKKDCINRLIEGKLPESSDTATSWESIQNDLNELTAGRKRILVITQIFVNYSKRFLNTQIQPWEKDDHWIVGEKTRKLAKLEKDISADNIVTVVQMAMALKDVSEKLLNEKFEAEKRIADKKHLSEEDKQSLEVFFQKLKHTKIPQIPLTPFKKGEQASPILQEQFPFTKGEQVKPLATLIYIVEKALNDLNKKYLVNKNSIFCHLRYALIQNGSINENETNSFSNSILEVLEQFQPGFILNSVNSRAYKNDHEKTQKQNENESSSKKTGSKKEQILNGNGVSNQTKNLKETNKKEFTDETPIFEVLNDPIKNNYVPTTFEKFKTNCGGKSPFRAKTPMPWGQKLRIAIEETKKNSKREVNIIQNNTHNNTQNNINENIQDTIQFESTVIYNQNDVEVSLKTELERDSKNLNKVPETISLMTHVEEQIKLIRSVWNNPNN